MPKSDAEPAKPRLHLTLTHALSDALDEWRSRQRPIPTRQQAVLLLAERALVMEGVVIEGEGED